MRCFSWNTWDILRFFDGSPGHLSGGYPTGVDGLDLRSCRQGILRSPWHWSVCSVWSGRGQCPWSPRCCFCWVAWRNGGPFRKHGGLNSISSGKMVLVCTCLLFFHPLQWLFFVVKTVYPCRSGTLAGQNVSATPPHVGRRIWKMPSGDFCHTVALSGFVQQNPRLYQNFPYSTTVRPNSNKRSSVVGPHTRG